MLKFRRTSMTERQNTWPGFVDLFSNLVIILIFLLIVFVFLWTTTSIFNKSSGVAKVVELTRLNKDQAATIMQMAADEQEAKRLLVMARSQLETLETERQALEMDLSDMDAQAADYESRMATLKATGDGMSAQLQALTAQLRSSATTNTELENQRQSLAAEIARLNDALAAAQAAAEEQEIQYIELTNQLNRAMSDKVAELAKYQSQFYGAVKSALAGFPGVSMDGDRFVVSSDILFPKSSYQLSVDGKKQLKIIASLIKDLESKIPSDTQWIIRVDGHTDKTPVIPGTQKFKNNTELSLLRAQAVVNELASGGASRARLIPSGFGETHPFSTGTTPDDLQKNRRIELRLTMP